MRDNQDYVKIIGRIKQRENRLKNHLHVENSLCQYNIFLLLDSSSSMEYNNKLVNAKKALERFIKQTDLKENSISVITFGENIKCSKLSCDCDYLIRQVNQIKADGATPMLKAIKLAEDNVSSDKKTILIIATDGEPTRKMGFLDFMNAKDEILNYIQSLKTQGVRFITIGIGNDVNEDFLKQVASSEKDYYYSEESIQLDHIYQKIARGLKLKE